VQTRNKKRSSEFASVKKQFIIEALLKNTRKSAALIAQEITLTKMEKQLCESMHLLTVPGKMGKPASILLTNEDWTLLGLLVAEERGANDTYLFQSSRNVAGPSSGDVGYNGFLDFFL
jgi:hypothetical protein